MKNKIASIIAGFIVTFLITSCTPNAEEIFKKSYDKCQSIENGYYEMNHSMKYMTKSDTVSSSFNCYFQKLSDDSIYSSAFHYKQFYKGEYLRNVLYTGDDLVDYWANDSAGIIMSKNIWASEIKSLSHNHTFFSVITNRMSYPLPNEYDFNDDKNRFHFIGVEDIEDITCYHLKMINIPEKDTSNVLNILEIEKQYWINKLDFIPIQYTFTVTLEEFGDTMVEFVKFALKEYKLDYLKTTDQLDLSSIPDHIILQDYKPRESPELLANNTIAPEWSLISLKDETINLTDLKGNLVLIDFFYKSCHPCVLALPGLQELHEKYRDSGLRIIGIDPYDTKEEDDIENFLAKRGVTYTVLLDGKSVAKQYNVPGYPTMYLINRDGNVIYSQVGYGKGTDEKLEELIKENLQPDYEFLK